jgi:hypothetical protein
VHVATLSDGPVEVPSRGHTLELIADIDTPLTAAELTADRYAITPGSRARGEVTVARGVDLMLDRPVTVIASERVSQDFLDAVDRIGRLTVTGLDPIIDVLHPSGGDAVMWVAVARPGMSLREWVERRPRPSAGAVVGVLAQLAPIADALEGAGAHVPIDADDVIVEVSGRRVVATVPPIVSPPEASGASARQCLALLAHTVLDDAPPAVQRTIVRESGVDGTAVEFVDALRAAVDAQTDRAPEIGDPDEWGSSGRRWLLIALVSWMVAAIVGLLLVRASDEETITLLPAETTSPPATAAFVDDPGLVSVTTVQATAPIETTAPAPTVAPLAVTQLGYRLVLDRGVVVDRGDLTPIPGVGNLAGVRVVAAASTPGRTGLWATTSAGEVISVGSAPALTDLPALGVVPTSPIIDIVATSAGSGAWLVGEDGGIFALGNALPLVNPTAGDDDAAEIVDAAAVPGRDALLLLDEDGEISVLGNSAAIAGPSSAPAADVVAVAATPTGDGAWIIDEDGGVTPLGAATPIPGLDELDVDLARPIVQVGATVDGAGLWLLAADGGVFALGSATPFSPYLVGAGSTAVDFVVVTPT